MSNVNTVAVSGNLTRDPEFKQVNESFAVAKLGIAVNRQIKKSGSEEYEDVVSYFDIEVLGEGFAKLVARKLKKGDSAFVKGRIEQQRWETEEGNRSKVVIIAETIDSEGFFRSKDEDATLNGSTAAAAPAAEAQPAAAAPAAEPPPADDDIPF